MLRQLEQIPYIKDLVKRLNRYKEMRLACGYGEKVPTEAHFSQMKKRVGVQGFRAVEEWLRHEALRLRESQPLSAIGQAEHLGRLGLCACRVGLCCSKPQNRYRQGMPIEPGRGKKGFHLGLSVAFSRGC